jgi:hypothetical protein
MAKRKEGEKICFKCSKYIDTNKGRDHYVLLGTYNRSHSADEVCYFHFQCWVEWFMRKVNDRARMQVQGMQKMAVQLTQHPLIKNALSQIQGGDQILSMLNIPLSEKRIDNIKIVVDKIQDGRKKRAKRRKSK